MLASPKKLTSAEVPLQLLLFIDKRPSSLEQSRQIQRYLQQTKAKHAFALQVIEVGEQPYLAEHFKIVATPALIKIYPEPRQIIAGSNLLAQLKNCWARWQHSAAASQVSETTSTGNCINSITYSAELMRLSDEIFRLKQEKEELQERLRFKDRLIAMLAHELRNPLTAASIALETLESHYHPEKGGTFSLTPALTAQLIKHARTQTRIIDKMISDLLQADQATSAKLCIQPQSLDLGALCQEVCAQFRARLQAKSQELKTDIPPDLPYVYADPERVRQVLVNLLDNAIKYTPEGGKITLSALHRTTQKVQVSICDNGPGIPPESQKHIFEEHFRLPRDEMKEGYGIGLSLCQRIIRAHYGQIWVDSTPNQGSSFHFTLPVYRF
ncbi:MAG: histidine kinase [Oscillatoriaceae bacterium SKW80]|nr:histidine kinase [Oscillatoriaceae bacterium SKYG93]MCX8121834.1 histidine kinase [Oscillatoriaceae bacterium SKW80]MDW8454595.1 histidine kinase [Oscillatoriaceae cyanobacterium SKYGB_i_bin93]HIK27407.1 histidine kinase [Oscillatoriaceae cyanobacterium M7585_C2015_266]